MQYTHILDIIIEVNSTYRYYALEAQIALDTYGVLISIDQKK